MKNVIWKAYKLGDLFERTTPPATNCTAKELDIYDEPFDGSVALITRAETNNGIRGYIKNNGYPTLKRGITYNDQFSLFLFHNYEFTTIKDHLSILHSKYEKLNVLMLEDKDVDNFLIIIFNKIFSKEIFNFNYTGADFKFTREIIMLPCLEVAEGEDYIWEENGKHYTLAVEYIKKLMDQAKELCEQKTIRLYEAERAKYEAERAKYEAGYEREKSLLVWKGFKLGDLFDFSGNHIIKSQIKNLTVYDEYEPGTVGNVTASKENNGIVGYITETDEIMAKKKKHILTIASDAAYAGICYYQKDYVVSTGHNKMIDLAIPEMKKLFEKEELLYSFMAKMLTKIFCKTFYGFSKSITEDDFYKNFIMLPCLEVAEGEDYIWEENGKHYTLAVEYISYIYLSGRVNKNQKLIDTYSYQY